MGQKTRFDHIWFSFVI